jgi:DEAD/DEAH box helicase domain-containing protein
MPPNARKRSSRSTPSPAEWTCTHQLTLPAIEGAWQDVPPTLSPEARRYLTTAAPKGLYRHQAAALEHALAGEDTCLATKTASGKSLLFYVSAIELLLKNPDARVIVFYPLKALATEQEERWKAALALAGLPATVGRIDGGVSQTTRARLIKYCTVLVMTPDVAHAWLLSSVGDKTVQHFLSRLRLLIVDEVHTYTGVFGSNAAYLLRRLEHVVSLLHGRLQFIAASATLRAAEDHLANLFGRPFTFIGPELDSAPRHELTCEFWLPPKGVDFLTALTTFIANLAPEARFICFVDSRKLTEQITTILARRHDQAGDGPGDDDPEPAALADPLQKLDVLPYRAGYETADREFIRSRLATGKLRGIVSTSALELGLDIPSLNAVLLVGMPRSATSLYQRIGRVGRHAPGRVLLIHTGDIYAESIFRNPPSLFSLPMAEGALYLENRRIQYIHTLCLARGGGEHDQVQGEDGDPFLPAIHWPRGFADLCHKEQLGAIPPDLQAMKMEAGEDPNHTFPLRDVETQFKVELKQGPVQRPLGDISHAQLLREAYPGAVYYYATQPYRVYRVSTHARTVHVRPEKHYSTVPNQLPTLVFPNFSPEAIHGSYRAGDIRITECDVQIREAINGYKERRGATETPYVYPLDATLTGLSFERDRFTRNFFTSGVVLTHPLFNDPIIESVAALIYEAFLRHVPFETRDVSFATDKHRADRGDIPQGARFIAIFDQTYGSLRLTARLTEPDILRSTLYQARELGRLRQSTQLQDVTTAALDLIDLLYHEALEPLTTDHPAHLPAPPGEGHPVIAPGSIGLALTQGNAEFLVEGVFYSPTLNGLAYRGHYTTSGPPAVQEVTITLPLSSVAPIPGESTMARYILETGEIHPIE